MHGDLDDTWIAPPRLAEHLGPETDHDDTIVRGSAPAARPVEPPPALIEPPAPEKRSIPAPVDPVVEDMPETALPESSLPGQVVEPEKPAAAPAAFVARLANGTVLAIDGPVYLGRKPSAPRIHTGPPPRLVTFPSPSRELSATHLELRVVGGALVATDMRSTNGTVVRLPGSAPRALIRGESAVVVPGTRIDLGDGAIVDIFDTAEPA